MHLPSFHLAPAAILLIASCGADAPTSSGSGSASTATSSSTPAAAASGTAASPPASASAAPSAPAMTSAEFCARVVKLGEEKLAKCDKEDQNQRTYLDFKPSVESAAKDCAERVSSAQVDFHADVAATCLATLEKAGGDTSFAALTSFRECAGVFSGKATAGQTVKLAEECAVGLGWLDGKCSAPPKKLALAERCNLLDNNCPANASCYQGKCRAQVGVDGECMSIADCTWGLRCDIAGGLFGKCAAPRPLGEKCAESWDCESRHCRARKCTAFCGQ